jgi:hypothetical protein
VDWTALDQLVATRPVVVVHVSAADFWIDSVLVELLAVDWTALDQLVATRPVDVVHVSAADSWIDSVFIELLAVDWPALDQLVATWPVDVVDVPTAESFLLMDNEHVEAADTGCIWGQGSRGGVGFSVCGRFFEQEPVCGPGRIEWRIAPREGDGGHSAGSAAQLSARLVAPAVADKFFDHNHNHDDDDHHHCGSDDGSCRLFHVRRDL